MDLRQLEYSRKSLRAAHSPRQRRNCTWCSLCQLFDTGSGHLSGLVANGRVCRFAISPITKRYLTEGPLPMRWYRKSRIRSEPCQARWRERPLPQSWGAKIVMETAPGKTCLRCAPRHQGRSRQPGDGDRTRAKARTQLVAGGSSEPLDTFAGALRRRRGCSSPSPYRAERLMFKRGRQQSSKGEWSWPYQRRS